MKPGDKVLVYKEYKEAHSNSEDTLLLKSGTILTIKHCDPEHPLNTGELLSSYDIRNRVTFEELEDPYYFPNDYMKLYQRENNLKVLLDGDR